SWLSSLRSGYWRTRCCLRPGSGFCTVVGALTERWQRERSDAVRATKMPSSHTGLDGRREHDSINDYLPTADLRRCSGWPLWGRSSSVVDRPIRGADEGTLTDKRGALPPRRHASRSGMYLVAHGVRTGDGRLLVGDAGKRTSRA